MRALLVPRSRATRRHTLHRTQSTQGLVARGTGPTTAGGPIASPGYAQKPDSARAHAGVVHLQAQSAAD